MSKGISRRDWLKLVGGSAAGLMLTPIPWKILDETAKWSQNWSWTPVPRNGKVNFKYTTCTLCPMACGVRARCIDNQPVSLSGIANHPVSGGGLCAIGLGGHLLPYHPARLLRPMKVVKESDSVKTAAVSYEEQVSAVIKAVSSSKRGSVAILDGLPNRTISFAYREFLGRLSNGVYVVPPVKAEVPSWMAKEILDKKKLSFGFDLTDVQTILSFGAPVLDGWTTLGQFAGIAKRRTAKDELRIIQVETVHSRTAQLASQWIPVKPGTEAAFALSIANVLINERLCDVAELKARSSDFENGTGRSFMELMKKFTPENAAQQTGIPEDKIIAIARELVSNSPSLVVADGATFSKDEQTIFMDLNILLDAVRAKGGIVPRKELPNPIDDGLVAETQLADVPDHSIKILILDGAESGSVFPWRMLQEKLVTDEPVVISLSPYLSGFAIHADYLIPSPAYLESFNDSPTPRGASTASYSISTPILQAPSNVMQPLDFLEKISDGIHVNHANEIFSVESLLNVRVEKLLRSKDGVVFDGLSGKTTKLTDISSPEKLMSMLSNGGCWYSEESGVQDFRSNARYCFLGKNKDGLEKLSAAADRHMDVSGLALLPYTAIAGPSHQLMGKIYNESDLRLPGNVASMNPETAKTFHLPDGCSAKIKTENGTSTVKVKLDPAIMPGAIQVSIASVTGQVKFEEENILEIFKIENDSTWRTTKAEISPA